MWVDLTVCRLRLGRSLAPHETPKLRGFFGRRFAQEILLHNHSPDGKLIYTYPRVQFKVIDRMAFLVGVGEGSELLQRLWLTLDKTRIGSEELPVLETRLVTRRIWIGEIPQPKSYRFLTPWLALNQENERRFRALRDPVERKEFLSRILIGNCLSLAKGLNHTVQETLCASFLSLREVRCSLKGIPMIGFKGEFRVNFQIPDLLGIGKSVSRGFGTVESVGPS